MQKGVFYQVAQLVKMLVVLALFLAVFLRWYNNLHPGLHSCVDDSVRVISTVCQQKLCPKSIYQRDSLCAIRSGT